MSQSIRLDNLFEVDELEGTLFEEILSAEGEETWEGEVNRSSADYVRWIQQSLNRILNLRLAVDGDLGPMTRSAIRSFQQKQGLAADGIVGSITEAALVRAGAGQPPSGTSPAPRPQPAPVTNLPPNAFIVGGQPVPPPAGLRVRNFADPSVVRFTNTRAPGRTVNEIIIHETVTTSVQSTVSVLLQRKLGVQMIMGADGEITQHGDLVDDLHWHASQHNTYSIGIEVVNPYYETNPWSKARISPSLPWKRVISAGWAHGKRYVVPTPEQMEGVARLIAWSTSGRVPGLSIPRRWIALQGSRFLMSTVPGADQRSPGIYAHSYFNHADGSLLVLYSYLRIERGLSQQAAYDTAVRLGETSKTYVDL